LAAQLLPLVTIGTIDAIGALVLLAAIDAVGAIGGHWQPLTAIGAWTGECYRGGAQCGATGHSLQ
jgi:hypothetical protein